MARPKKYIVSLSDDEVKRLKTIIKKKETSRTLRCRCQILLDLDTAHGKTLTYEQCQKTTGVCKATVSNIARLYGEQEFEAVITIKRNVNSDNTRLNLDGRAEALIIEIACSPAPAGHSRWTFRLLEGQAKVVLETLVSKDTIGRALKKQTPASYE